MKNKTKLENLLFRLSDKERRVLAEAQAVIYFGDSSDYLATLWNIVDTLSDGLIEECDDSELYGLLHKEVE